MNTSLDWLELAAGRAAGHEWSLGASLASYMEVNACTEEQMATELGCSLETLRRIALCRRPRADHFAADVDRVASHFGVSARTLLHVARQASVLRAMGSNAMYEETPALMAARDRREDGDS